LEGIPNNNHVELVWGNLYAALISFLNLIRLSHKANMLFLSQIDSNPFALSLVTLPLRYLPRRLRNPWPRKESGTLKPSAMLSTSLSTTKSTFASGKGLIMIAALGELQKDWRVSIRLCFSGW
jgi:hypothetical protein